MSLSEAATEADLYAWFEGRSQSKHMRPVVQPSDVVNVDLSLTLIAVEDIVSYGIHRVLLVIPTQRGILFSP